MNAMKSHDTTEHTTQDNKNHNGNHNGHNGSVISDLDTLRKQPPKTLPKPKVKPVPPPKPKKSFAAGSSNGGNDADEDGSTAPLISFHDEGFDGSEV